MLQKQSWIISAFIFGLTAFGLSYLVMHELNAVRAWAVWVGASVGILSANFVYRFLSYASDTTLVSNRIARLRRKNIREIIDDPLAQEREEDQNISEFADFSRKILFYNEEKLQEIRLNLIRAGFYKEFHLMNYLICKIVLPVALFIIAFVIAYFQERGLQTSLIASVLCALVGWILIDQRVETMGKDRREKINDDLADALDMLVIYAETGVAFDNALPKVADEIYKSAPEIATEFRILNRELRLLSSRVQAYENFLERVPLQPLKTFVSILQQSETVGTPIAEAVKQISLGLRNERMLEAERKAAQIPVKITLPLIACIFPVLLLIILGPVALNIIDNFRF